MGLKVATRLAWLDAKVKRSTIQSGGETIADQFGAAWDVSLGRRDAEAADPEGRLPQPGASTQEIKVHAEAGLLLRPPAMLHRVMASECTRLCRSETASTQIGGTSAQDFFFKLGNTKPEGGFGSGKPPFWERIAFVIWTGAADDQDAEGARLTENDVFKGW